MKVPIQLVPRPALPEGTAAMLRALADDIDRGNVTQLIIGCVRNSDFEFQQFSSATDSLVLANLLHMKCLDMFRVTTP